MSRQKTTPNDNVTRIVRTLLAHRGQQQADLAAHLKMDSGTISRAMNTKRRWTLDDLVAMGEFFDVSPALFFEDPDTLIKASRGRRAGDRESAATESDDGPENHLILDRVLVAA